MIQRTNLAWKNLTSSWTKLLLSVSGVGMAVLLMFSQIGFRNGMFDSTVQLAEILEADLFMVSKARYNLPSEQRFEASLLRRARQVEGVAAIRPIYVERSGTELRVVGSPSRSIRVIAVPLGDGVVFSDPSMDRLRDEINQSGTGLLDRRTKRMYGLDTKSVERLRKQDIELSGRSLRLVDYIDIGTDFVHDGSIVLGERTFESYFPFRNPGRSPTSVVDFGAVQLEPGVNAAEVREALNEIAPIEWEALSKRELIQREIRFWGTAAPIGIIFAIGTVMGLIVGAIICYQIIFTDIHDHMAEFATLKAMGYPPFFFTKLIVRQSVYLTILGFIPACLLSYGIYEILTATTGLIMRLTFWRIALVFFLTLAMCLAGGILAVRKLNSSDPASLF